MSAANFARAGLLAIAVDGEPAIAPDRKLSTILGHPRDFDPAGLGGVSVARDLHGRYWVGDASQVVGDTLVLTLWGSRVRRVFPRSELYSAGPLLESTRAEERLISDRQRRGEPAMHVEIKPPRIRERSMTTDASTSTIAASASSELAVCGPMTAEQLRDALATKGFDVAQAALDAALDAAVERGLLTREGDLFVSPLPRGHVIRERDEADAEGWEGWRSQPLNAEAE